MDAGSISYSDWLMDNAGPVIRFRTASEFLPETNEAESAEKELLSDNLVRYWLENLKPDFGRNALHGAKTEAYENVMGKLRIWPEERNAHLRPED